MNPFTKPDLDTLLDGLHIITDKSVRKSVGNSALVNWGEIILPKTPPLLFAETVTIGSMPIFSAVTACSLPKRAFEEVSDPVMNTPNHPSIAAKNGKSCPDAANAYPSVIAIPE